MKLQFTVQQAENRMMLRDFLRKHGVSSALMTHVKTQDGFYHNGVSMRTNERIETGAVVSFSLPPEQKTSVEPEDLPLDIVYEDAHVMVLNKDAGQTVHPTRGYVSGTLANAFCGEMQRRGNEKVFRPINRIDRNTSGLVLCALHAYAAPLLAASAAKVYEAIVQGTLPVGTGCVQEPIARCEDSIIKRCTAPQGQPSCTQYEVTAVGAGHSFVRVVPITGRTHQIRVHFAHVGHPLAGDDLYGGDTRFISRHALHCSEISFDAIATKERIAISQKLAPDMQTLHEKWFSLK